MNLISGKGFDDVIISFYFLVLVGFSLLLESFINVS